MTSKKEIAEYCALRDRAVLGSLRKFMAFAEAQGYPFSDPKVAEIGQHKMRTSIATLPIEVRKASKAWLLARGYVPHDDGDV